MPCQTRHVSGRSSDRRRYPVSESARAVPAAVVVGIAGSRSWCCCSTWMPPSCVYHRRCRAAAAMSESATERSSVRASNVQTRNVQRGDLPFGRHQAARLSHASRVTTYAGWPSASVAMMARTCSSDGTCAAHVLRTCLAGSRGGRGVWVARPRRCRRRSRRVWVGEGERDPTIRYPAADPIPVCSASNASSVLSEETAGETGEWDNGTSVPL